MVIIRNNKLLHIYYKLLHIYYKLLIYKKGTAANPKTPLFPLESL